MTYPRRRTLLLVAAIVVVELSWADDKLDEKRAVCAYVDKDAWKNQEKQQFEAAAEYQRQQHANGEEVDLSSLKFGDVLSDNKTMRCAAKDFCYTLWQPDPSDPDARNILKQGCWGSMNKDKNCLRSACESVVGQPNSLNNTLFCCCQGDMCNTNITVVHATNLQLQPSSVVTPESSYIISDRNYAERTAVIAISSVASFAVCVCVFYFLFRVWWRRTHKCDEYLETATNLMEGPATPVFELDQLKISSVIDRGRYGEVWLASLNEQEVAVKLFASHQRQYYINERDIYMLPFMDHDALPRFYGAEERIGENGQLQYLVVMSYIPMGTLTQFLKENAIDWVTMCRMFLSCAGGLAHLHSDIIKGDKCKPSIAHRDFNTRNILVKTDLSCCVCDLGFAMKIQGSRFFRNGFEENAEQSSLTDVGTLRYMAPEVLEGAVNLRDCESSLKQIDVYALGLVLWEVASRCTDLYQGMPTPTYQLPFQAEVGLHPSFDDMQHAVSREKDRPKFPDVWKDTNPAVRALKETIDDCWDQDAEARLTSLCVEERILEMMTLLGPRHKGVTPTINSSSGMSGGTDNSVVRNIVGSLDPNSETDRVGYLAAGHSPFIMDSLSEPSSGARSNRLSQGDNSVSASTTVTELTMSPSTDTSEPPSYKSNYNMNNAKNNRILQPHQGQNPTFVRNTHKRSDEELTILGNKLVDKNLAMDHRNQLDDNRTHEDIFDAIVDNLESSLVQNDSLNQQQRQSMVPLLQSQVAPAPNSYPQHHVNLSEPIVVRPKMPNVPGNGSLPSARASHVEAKSKPKFRFKKPKCDKYKGISLPFFSKKQPSSSRQSDNTDYFPTENLIRNPLPLAHAGNKPGPSAQAEAAAAHQRYSCDATPYAEIQGKSNLDPRPVSTEVRLYNGLPIVRPTSLPVQSRGGSNGASRPVAMSVVPGYEIDQTAATAWPMRETNVNIHHPSNESIPEESSLNTSLAMTSNVAKQPQIIANLQGASNILKAKAYSSADLSPGHGSVRSSRSASPNVPLGDSDKSLPRPNSLAKAPNHKRFNNQESANNKNQNQVEASQNIVNNSKNSLSSEQNFLNNGGQDYVLATQSIDRLPNRRLKSGKSEIPAYLCDDHTLSRSAGNVNLQGWDANQKEPEKNSTISLQLFGNVDTNGAYIQDIEC